MFSLPVSNSFDKYVRAIVSASVLAALVGCNSASSAGQTSSGSQSTSTSSGGSTTSNPTQSINPTPTPTSTSTTVGSSCHSADGSTACIGLKYVVYNDTTGKPVASQSDATSNLATINQRWAQCKIAFQIDQYLAIDPTQYKLNFTPADDSELDPIREALGDDTHFLVVTTGTWDRSGTLGSTGANAWTNMPGDGVYGSILEAPVATYPNIIAHELGHYMNLDHVSDESDLMNPIIYDTSTHLTSDQCATANAAIQDYWKAMIR